MANPTNKDIMEAVMGLNTQMSAVTTTLTAVKLQTEKTNGRVTKIEEWKNALQAVEQYKKESQPKTIVNAKTANVTPRLDSDAVNKLLIGLGVLATAVAGWLTYISGGLK